MSVRLSRALATARADLDRARHEEAQANLDHAALRALLAIGELLAGIADHLAADE